MAVAILLAQPEKLHWAWGKKGSVGCVSQYTYQQTLGLPLCKNL